MATHEFEDLLREFRQTLKAEIALDSSSFMSIGLNDTGFSTGLKLIFRSVKTVQ